MRRYGGREGQMRRGKSAEERGKEVKRQERGKEGGKKTRVLEKERI